MAADGRSSAAAAERHEPARDARALEVAKAAALACGVTRLADVTRLDCLGVHVWQAVRPRSRALAVHQGKGRTDSDAQIGALMEAVESAHAEAFDRSSAVACWRDLPRGQRMPSLADCARIRTHGVGRDEPVVWTLAERLLGGPPLQVPLDCVSLDCVRPWDRRLDHTSNGLGARFDAEGAALKGLLEVLERDAVAAWRRLPLPDRAMGQLDAGAIAYPWFGDLAERLTRAGIALSLHAMPTIVGLPAVFAELFDPSAYPAASALGRGWSCAPSAEEALLGAMLEACQARLTAISGARDDILFDEGRDWSGEAIPLPPNIASLEWEAWAEARGGGPTTPQAIAERLAKAGYPDTAVIRLSRPDDRVCVVKVFVPGLGANLRSRREPGARRVR